MVYIFLNWIDKTKDLPWLLFFSSSVLFCVLFRSTILERVTWQKKEHVFFKADGSPYISESDNPIECQKYGDGPISLNTKCKITYQQLIFFYVTISPSSQTTCFAKQGKNIFFMVFSLILISVFYLNCFLFQIL